MKPTQKYEDYDRDHPANQDIGLEHDQHDQFTGLQEQRSVRTDIGWVGIFFLLNIVVVLIAQEAFRNGDYKRLKTGFDFRAELCGQGKFANYEFTYFTHPESNTAAMCRQSCPSADQTLCMYKPDPTEFYDDETQCVQTYETTTIGHYCVPYEQTKRDKVLDYLYETDEETRRNLGDIHRSWLVMSAACGIAAGFALLIILSLNIKPLCKFIIWFCSIMFLASIFFWLYYLVKDEDRILDMKCNGEESRSSCKNDFGFLQRVLFWVMMVLGVIAALFIAIEYQSISATGALYAQINQFIRKNKALFIVPVFQLVVGFILTLFFLSTLIFSSSVGEVVLEENVKDFPGGKIKTIDYSDLFNVKAIFLILMLFWWLEFISRIGEMIVAGATSIWFFRADSVTSRTKKSAYFVFRYHLGSCLLAAFLIPLVMPFRATFGVLRSLVGRWKQASSCGNCLVSLFSCCLEVYEKGLKYIYNHACIYVVIWGDAFGWSGSRAWYIMSKASDTDKSNTIESLPHLDSVNNLVMYITRILVGFIGALVAYAYLLTKTETLTGEDTEFIESMFIPALVCFVASYYLADYCLGLFDATSSTVLQCIATEFCVFKGEQHQAHEELRAFVDNFLSAFDETTKVASTMISSKPVSTGKQAGLYSAGAYNRNKEALYADDAVDEEDEEDYDPYDGYSTTRNLRQFKAT